MADEKETLKPKERVKYKFGQNDIDLTNYIHNLGTNVLSYLNSKNWNEGLKQEFINAYNRYLAGLQELLANNTNRFTTDDFGSIIDSTGVLSNTDNDDIDGSEYYYDNKGNRITTSDFKELKKRKLKNYNTFSANREVATYFNTIGNALKGMETPKEKGQDAFNLSKHGFLADWTTANNPAGGNFNLDLYLEKDAIDETTGKRGTSNRATYLKELIENYINNIGEYDFSSSPFKNRDTYISRLRAAAKNLENGYDLEDVIALNLAGIGNEFLSKFFATGNTNKPKTEVELAAEDILKMLKAELDEAIIKLRDLMQYELERNKYFDNYLELNPFLSSINGTTIAPAYNLAGMNEAAADKFKVDKTDLASMLYAIKTYIDFPWLASLIRGKNKFILNGKDITLAHIANNLDWMKQSGLFMDPKYLNDKGESILPNGFYVIPGSEDYLNWSYLAYNPTTRLYYELSMLLDEELRKRMAYDEYDRLKLNTPKKENGGILIFLGGGLAQWVEENKKKAEKALKKELDIQTKIKETGKTRELVEAAERRPMEEGFSTVDKIRLGTAAADAAAAAAAFIPGYGTVASGVLGIGSTLTNIGADIADKSMSGWDVAGNALYGLGMDVVGLIPGLGTTGKAAKIVRVLKPVSQLAMRALLTYGMIHSASAFKKLMSNPSDMSADDWRNLITGLQAISGEARYRGGTRAVNRTTTQRDVADVKTSTGKVATISAEDLDKLRKTKGLKALNKLFSELTGGLLLLREFKGRKVNWRRPWKSKFSSSGPEVSERTEFSFLTEDNSLDARLFRGMNRNTPQRKQQKKQLKTQLETLLSRFDRLRQLSSQTGKLTPQEINLINGLRAKQKLPALSQQEIDALNARRAYRGELNALIAETFHGRFPTHYWSKKLGLSGLADNARYINRREIQKEVKAALEELALITRLQRLPVSTGLGEIISPNANLARFVIGLSHAIPTVNPSRPPISNPPAIIPKLLVKQPQLFPFNYNRIREGLARAERERLGKDIGELKLLRAIEANPERNARLQSEEAYRNVRLAFNLYGVPLYKRPLTGAAYKAKLDMYNKLFNLRRYDVIEAFRSRELPHRQSNKKKKTSRDDRRTVRREDGGTLDLIRVRKFQSGGNSSITTVVSTTPPSQESSNKSFFSNINPTITYGLLRAMYADRTNRKITDLAKESVVPLLKDPSEVHRYTRSDLDAEMQGERNYANLRRLASRPITSDGSLQTATLLLAEVLGQEARMAGKEKSNLVQRLYDELAWQQERENATNRHEAAMFNRELQLKANLIKSEYELAYLAKKFNIWDVLGQLLEQDARTKQLENKALADNFARSDIHNAISYTPNDYGANLTPDELTAWNKVLSGTNPSNLLPEELTSYKLAALKVSRTETEQLRLYYNVPNTRWSGWSRRVPWSPTLSKALE